MPNPFFAAVSSAGIGTGIGYIAAAVIQARSAKNTKAEDASVLVTAATELTDRLLRRNNDLARINAQLRQALGKLIDAVQLAQDTFQRFPDIGDGLANRNMMVLLQQALDAANAIEL